MSHEVLITRRQSIFHLLGNDVGSDPAMCISVIQVRMDQGLVVKIRCPMRS